MPDAALDALAALPGVSGVSLDRRVRGTLERTGATIGATLGPREPRLRRRRRRRRDHRFRRHLVARRPRHRPRRALRRLRRLPAAAYDDYGHGTHVAGIIAGNGYDSDGAPPRHRARRDAARRAQGARRIAATGYISNVIAAIDYAIANSARCNIRVINLSVAAGVYESYNTDPLTLAAKRAVEAGIVVVTAAGNLGADADGHSRSTAASRAPGNAPWVLTVGASSHNGTVDRADDIGGGVQLARAERDRLTAPSRISSRRASASSRWPTPAARSSRRKPQMRGCGARCQTATRAVPEPERHQHGRAGGQPARSR